MAATTDIDREALIISDEETEDLTPDPKGQAILGLTTEITALGGLTADLGDMADALRALAPESGNIRRLEDKARGMQETANDIAELLEITYSHVLECWNPEY